ncbi:MAG: tRNA pseudouridine(38-40) synthase TruA [Sulfuricellaceae bacterium]|nr:tRNA pseudouridine(38-40) synthase TruA [Sulfuricellaceae bacterium]
MRIVLQLEYNGAHFCGWQSQSDRCGVQDALEAALSIVAGEPIRVHAAGRTDAGVHAFAQIVHFDTRACRPTQAWIRGTNAHLNEHVSVLWANEIEDDFHARFSALERQYRYLLLNHSVRPGLNAGRVSWFHAPLDVARMQEGARLLQGEHDFSAFRAAECQAHSPIRNLRTIQVARESGMIVFDLAANGFLHHMVRNIVGSLVYVGKGKHPPDWIGTLLASRDRKLAAPTFSADGLYFSGVRYDERWKIPETGREILLP